MSIFYRYLKVLSMLVGATVILVGSIQAVLSYQEAKRRVSQLQQAEARAAAAKIEEYLKGIERPLRHVARLSFAPNGLTREDQVEEFRRLLRVLPAISDLRKLDRDGRELVHVSRTELDRIGSGIEIPNVKELLRSNKDDIAYSPAYFRDGIDPYTSVLIKGFEESPEVTLAELNLKFVADVVASITVGRHGKAYVLDSSNRLLAHPSLRLLLRSSDLSNYPQLIAVRDVLSTDAAVPLPTVWATGPEGKDVLTSAVPIRPSNWLVFVEQPAEEVLESVRTTLYGTLALLLVALAASFIASLILARRLTRPILTLQRGAALIGAGNLAARLDLKTGDEIQALGDEFNRMAAQLQEYTTSLEHKVAEKTAQLELANRHKSEFLANMSHELRTPLNAIIGFSEVLKEKMFGELTAKQDEYVHDIHASGQHLLSLINDILDLSKVEAGRMELDLVEFEVRPVLENALTLIRERAQRGGVTVELRVQKDVRTLSADERKFKQIVVNLLSNAVKFTKTGGHITVSAAHDGMGTAVEISDTGIGIANEDLPRIFEQFQQIRSGGAAKHEGTGLGLTLTRRLVELHGGRLTANSELGRGSTFAVWLPSLPGGQLAGQ